MSISYIDKTKKKNKSISSMLHTRPDIIEFLEGNDDVGRIFDLPSNICPKRLALYKHLYKGIGKTDCYTVRLPNSNVLNLKMEYSNALGNSHYSRCWLPYLFIAETLEIIEPKQTHLIEVSSGSAGIALAMASQKLGYELTLIVPDLLPPQRVDPMMYYGAHIIKTPGYIDQCIKRLRMELVNSRGKYFPCNHSEEKADILVKIDKRIAHEYYKSYGVPDFCIIGLGNGTSTYSIFNYFEHAFPSVKKITYHPNLEGNDIVFGLYGPNVKLRHIDPALKLTDKRFITSGYNFTDFNDRFRYDTEMSNLGISSKYGVIIALELSKRIEGQIFFTIGYDKSDRY